MTGSTSLRLILASGTAFAALCALPGIAAAQTSDQTTAPAAPPTGAAAPVDDDPADKGKDIIVTGSRIKQDPNSSALPLTIITNQDLVRNSISSPEQLISFLPTNGSGPDNLASNSDVVSGAQRGTNGLSSANLRGQGSAATLVLLNGRRIAAHGLQGSAVDVNQIPFAAIDRVEILKDGASAIYGTDAVGGVINFITKKNFTGIDLQAFDDITEGGGGNIYRLSGTIGYGDLSKDGFNVMAAVSYSWNKILKGEDRDFVNGNQPNRGLSIETRGTPIATVFNVAANSFQTPGGTLLTGVSLIAPDGTNVTPNAEGGVNILDLPGGGGCSSMDGGMAYDQALFANNSRQYACAWDTGRAVVLTQPLNTLTYYGRAVVNIGKSQFSAELTGSKADSAKVFSNNQYSSNSTTTPIAYPLNAATAATYNSVFNALKTAFPAQAATLDARYGKPIAFRWRCIACGNREYDTTTKTLRGALALEGPLPFDNWDYRVGASYARSEAISILGNGYHYRGVLLSPAGQSDPNAPIAPGATVPGIVGLINAGILNPFSLDQTPAALAALNAVSANGVKLYNGRYEVRQFDASVSGPLFRIWGGDVQIAAGVDYRRETYTFNGSGLSATSPNIFNAAFDDGNAVTPKSRTVKAAYAELLVPLLPGLDITGAVRIDDYTGFGKTTNPKVSIKFQPIPQILFRGSYNTSFRVPTFNQIFNTRTPTPTTGANIADPRTCPTPTVPNPANPGCAIIAPDTISGGNPTLGPETAKQANLGVVIQPFKNFSASVDWWIINVDNSIQQFTFRQILENYSLFPERLILNSANQVTAIDSTWANAGARRTQGLEITFRGGFELGGTKMLSFGLDGSYLLKKRERLTQNAPYGRSLIGLFTYTGDLGLRWKHNAYITFSNHDVSFSLTQLFRKGYRNNALPGIANGTITRPDYNKFVKDYITYNLALSYLGLGPRYKVTFGVRNLFDTDPPFAITYDSVNGSGSSWEPRAADPRGRSFTMTAEVKF